MESAPCARHWPRCWGHTVTTAPRSSGPRRLWENGGRLGGCTSAHVTAIGRSGRASDRSFPAAQPGPGPGPRAAVAFRSRAGCGRTGPLSAGLNLSHLSRDRRVTLLVGPEKLRIAREAADPAAPATPVHSRREKTLPPEGNQLLPPLWHVAKLCRLRKR